MSRSLVACGTRSAYERHRYWCQDPCQPCIDAYRAYERQRWAARRARTDLPALVRATDNDRTAA